MQSDLLFAFVFICVAFRNGDTHTTHTHPLGLSEKVERLSEAARVRRRFLQNN